jgi:hypothetical protein
MINAFDKLFVAVAVAVVVGEKRLSIRRCRLWHCACAVVDACAV